jgi:hypothetical protein
MSNSEPAPFVVGEPYFIVVFDDEDMKVPLIQTVLFVKAAEADDGREGFLFQVLAPTRDPERMFLDTETALHLVRDRDRFMTTLQRTFDGTIGKPPPI